MLGINMYAITFLASVIMLILLIYISKNQNVMYYLLVFLSIMICNMGNYALSTAESLDAALLGHRLLYMGSTFVPIFMLFAIMKLCRMEIPAWLVICLLSMCTMVLYFAFSVGKRTFFYKNVSIATENGMTYLIKEYGPMHKLYMVYLFISIGLMIGVIFYSLLMKNIPRQVVFCILMMVIITTVCYLFRRISGSTFELITIAYIFDDILFLVLIRRIGKYEVMESIANSLNENSSYGYLVFDQKKRYVGCNEKAKEYLPEVENQKIDAHLDIKSVPGLYHYFGSWLEEPITDEQKCLIESEERVLECKFKILHPGKSKKIDGYLIELNDDTQQQKYLKLLNNYNKDLKKEVRKKTEYVNKLQERIVLGMADMIENRDTNTGGHVKRTSEVIKIFINELKKYAEEYKFPDEFLTSVVKAAPMHDLGKIAVDDRILRKPGKFTPEEFDEMKKHSEKGAEIVGQILDGVENEAFVRIAKNIAHYHHEKWNGEGYPDKLSGIGIPPEARIMALADVFDALVSKRCYKEKMDYDNAFRIIEESLGSHFDPELGKIFLRCRPQLESFYNSVE